MWLCALKPETNYPVPQPADNISRMLLGQLQLVIPFRDHDFVVQLQFTPYGELVQATTDLDKLPEVALQMTHSEHLARRQYQWELLRPWLEVTVAAHYWVCPEDATHPIGKAIRF